MFKQFDGWRTLSVISVVLTPLLNIVGSNFNELQRSSFKMILEPFVILALIGFSFSILLVLTNRFNKRVGNIFYLCLIPGLFLFFNFSAVYEGLIVLNDGALGVVGARFVVVLLVMFVIFMAVVFQNKHWWLTIISVSAFTFFLLSFFTFAINTVAYARISSLSTVDVIQPVEKSSKSQTLTNVYYVIADGLTGPKNYVRLTGEPIDFLYDTLRRNGFISIENARSNYFGSASSIGSIFHLKYFRNEKSDFSTPPPEDYFPSVVFKPNQSPTLNKLRSMGMDINFAASWYSGCTQINIKCIDDGDFNFNRLSLRVIDNSFARHLSTGALGTMFPRVLRRKVDAIGPVTRMLSDSKIIQSNQFTFIHHMQPHDPWYYDENCRHIVTRGQSRDELYRLSVRCLAKSFELLVRVILQKDADAIIVLQGDHGWLKADDKTQGPEASWDESTTFFRSEITNIVRLPARCKNWIEHGIGPVNTMRLVVACLEGRRPMFLEEALFIPDFDYERTGQLIRRAPAVVD